MNEYDIIIPVGLKDVGFVWRVIKYIRRCFLEAGKIYIITSKKNFRFLNNIKDNNISILDENSLYKGLTFQKVSEYLKDAHSNMRPGWYFQQFLKYAFALSQYSNKYYLSWDADTLPLTHIKFIVNGKPQFTIKSEYNPNYFKTIHNLLGIKKQTEGSFIAEHMIFKKDTVCELIHKIENSNIEGENWIQKIINACDFTEFLPAFSEFETYGNYVMAMHPNEYSLRHLNTFRCGGYIRGRQISDKMLKNISFDTDTISFELGMNPVFPANIPNVLIEFKVKLIKAKQIGIIAAFQKFLTKIMSRNLNNKLAKETNEMMTRMK